MTIDRFAIRFGDNDYGNTLRAFGDLIVRAVEWNSELKENLTKERIVLLWNELSYGLYLIYQHSWNDRLYGTYLLQITEDIIYINEEVDALLETKNFNHSWLIVYLTEHHQYCLVC